MVRKTVFSSEDVVRAAVAVVERGSLADLTARRVADEMGASTAPVYSNFENMEALTAAVKSSIAEQLLECTRRRHTDDEFLNMGLGVLDFVRRRPGLYCAIFMNVAKDDAVAHQVMEDMLGRMAGLPQLTELPPVERIILLRKMAIFTHGLATQLCSGIADVHSWEELTLLLSEVGHAIVADAFQRGTRSDEETALLGNVCTGARELPPAAGDEAEDPQPNDGDR
jgi:AcrR family transcriptional regulator